MLRRLAWVCVPLALTACTGEDHSTAPSHGSSSPVPASSQPSGADSYGIVRGKVHPVGGPYPLATMPALTVATVVFEARDGSETRVEVRKRTYRARLAPGTYRVTATSPQTSSRGECSGEGGPVVVAAGQVLTVNVICPV